MSDELLDSIPFGDLTTPEDGFGALMESVVNGSVGKKDKLKGKDQFNAIVLMAIEPPTGDGFSARQISAMFGTNITLVTNAGSDGDRFFGYRMRITDFDNPHAFYPIGCDITEKPTEVNKVIAGMHTLVITTEKLQPKDTCIIKLNKIGGKYELGYGFLVSKTGRDEEYFTRIQKANPYLQDACSNTGELFNARIGRFGGSSGGIAPTSQVDAGPYAGFPIYSRGSTPITPFGLGYRNKTEDYELIVLHTTVSPSMSWRANGSTVEDLGSKGASYHYIIEANGEVVQLIDHKVANAFHANTETDSYPNKYSVGISMSNVNDSPVNKYAGKSYKTANGATIQVPEASKWIIPTKLKCKKCNEYPDSRPHQPFTRKQVNALIKTIKEIKAAHPTIKYICGHEDITPPTRTDPGPAFFPFWSRVYRETGLTQSPKYPPKRNYRPSS